MVIVPQQVRGLGPAVLTDQGNRQQTAFPGQHDAGIAVSQAANTQGLTGQGFGFMVLALGQ